MPVRKITKNHLFVTGLFSSHKTGEMLAFESPLEKDYLLLLEFDDQVEHFEPQPVRIPIPGAGKSYVPDVLVRFKPSASGDSRPPQVTEVKATWDLQKNADKYAPKFEAAANYAAEREWLFTIKTEEDIRTPRLANLKFLRRYRNHEPAHGHLPLILDELAAVGGWATSEELLAKLAPAEDARMALLPSLWHMLITGAICTDLDEPMPREVPLWLPNPT